MFSVSPSDFPTIAMHIVVFAFWRTSGGSRKLLRGVPKIRGSGVLPPGKFFESGCCRRIVGSFRMYSKKMN